MKKLYFLFVLILAFQFCFSQFHISPGSEVYVSSSSILYSNEPVENEGTVTLNQDSKLVFDGNFQNDAVINYVNGTNKGILVIGSGDVTRSSTDQNILFHPTVEEEAPFIEFNKAGGTATIIRGHMRLLETFQSLNTSGTLNANSSINPEDAPVEPGKVFGLTFTNPDILSVAAVDESQGGIVDNVIIERYIPAKRAFRFLSSSVTTNDFIYENWQERGSTPATSNELGTHITGGSMADGFDQSGLNNPSMFTFNNSTQNWQALANTNAKKLNVGEAYLTMVRGDRTIDLTSNSSPATITSLRAIGDLFIGSFTFNVGNPIDYLNLSSEDDHFNFIANPYQAIVDYKAVNKSGLTDFIYVWDASITGNNGRGGYVTIDLTSSPAPPNPSSSDASQFIAPGMSFFVQNDNAPGDASISFNEANKVTGQNPVTVFETYPHFYINSRLYKTSNLENGETESDALGLRFNESYTTFGNNKEDATKFTNPDETYAVINNGLRSIDKQGLPNLGHEIDLSITNYTDFDYSLLFVMENKPESLGVFLNDDYLDTQTELTNSFVHNFVVDENIPESIASNRFSLVFDNTTLGLDENTFGVRFSLYPNPTKNGEFSIETPNLSGEVTVELSNILGQQVYNQKLKVEAQQVNVYARNLSSGVYIVKLTQENQSYSSKLIVE